MEVNHPSQSFPKHATLGLRDRRRTFVTFFYCISTLVVCTTDLYLFSTPRTSQWSTFRVSDQRSPLRLLIYSATGFPFLSIAPPCYSYRPVISLFSLSQDHIAAAPAAAMLGSAHIPRLARELWWVVWKLMGIRSSPMTDHLLRQPHDRCLVLRRAWRLEPRSPTSAPPLSSLPRFAIGRLLSIDCRLLLIAPCKTCPTLLLDSPRGHG